MFSRGSDAGSSQPLHVSSAAPGDNPSRSFIAPGLQVTGNLVSQGDLVIEGQVNGDIKGSHVVVGENATITGSIVADEIDVLGQVTGSLRGKRVRLQASSRMEGDIFHTTLSIQQGAYFEGKSRRSNDPTAPEDLAETRAGLALPKALRTADAVS